MVTTDPFDTNDPDTNQAISFGGSFTSFSRTFQTANATGWTVTANDQAAAMTSSTLTGVATMGLGTTLTLSAPWPGWEVEEVVALPDEQAAASSRREILSRFTSSDPS